MNYTEVKIYTTNEGFDPLTGLLLEAGVAGFVMEDPTELDELLDKKHPYQWDFIHDRLMDLKNVEPCVTFYVDDSAVGVQQLADIKVRLAMLKDMELAGEFGITKFLGSLHVTEKQVSDEEWKDNWKAYFKPSRITEQLVVKPTWEAYTRGSKDEKVIEIDPGMAFGTGTHATTRLCIQLLDKYMDHDKDVVLDVGCGSGILSIAAAALGASEVIGVDIDPEAVKVSSENVALNGYEDKIRIMYGDLMQGLDETADIILANLIADLVIRLAKEAATCLRGKKIYISSGILSVHKNHVSEELEKAGYEILETREEDEWCAIAARSLR